MKLDVFYKLSMLPSANLSFGGIFSVKNCIFFRQFVLMQNFGVLFTFTVSLGVSVFVPVDICVVA